MVDERAGRFVKKKHDKRLKYLKPIQAHHTIRKLLQRPKGPSIGIINANWKYPQHFIQFILALACGILLIWILLMSWQYEKIQSQQALSNIAVSIRDRVDHLISDVMQIVYSLNIVGNELTDCTHHLLPKLERLVFNNPHLSGIVISDEKNHVICSTFKIGRRFIAPSTREFNLLGPVKLQENDNPGFIIQQRLGNYEMGVFILQQVMEKTLKPPSKLVQEVALYDTDLQKPLLLLSRGSKGNTWNSVSPDLFIPHDFVSSTVTNRSFLQILLKPNQQQLSHLFWGRGILFSILTALVALFIYFYIYRIVQNYFSLHYALLSAVKNKHFMPAYLPIINTKLQRCVGAEILLRWHTVDGKIIFPSIFIEDAEQTGLIVPITLQIVETAFKDCKKILNEYPDFHLGINLSASHFKEDYFIHAFQALCSQYEIAPQQILLEVTERELLSQQEAAATQHMKKLRALGFALAIDDFGTGHASISYLQHFPFNYLKIDQLFVQSVGTGDITETLNESIIHMAQKLGLIIIAEGVETEYQARFLENHGIYLMQGWYFAKVMSFEQFQALWMV